jgi:hypothetical protein
MQIAYDEVFIWLKECSIAQSLNAFSLLCQANTKQNGISRCCGSGLCISAIRRKQSLSKCKGAEPNANHEDH